MHTAQGIGKPELLDYYSMVAERMLPHVKHRPLTLVSSRRGSERARNGKSPPSARVLDDAHGLFGLVRLGALEIHTCGSRADDTEHPDLLVFDLDPDKNVEYAAVIAGARALRELFQQAKLDAFVKTDGGRGLQVSVPISKRVGWDVVQSCAGHIARTLAERSPGLYVATQTKTARRGRTFIDYQRNARGACFIAPYSTRARAGAPIAVPLEWDELSPSLPPDHFNLRNIGKRLSLLRRDPFERLVSHVQRPLPERSAL